MIKSQENSRALRVADQIQRELADLLQREIKDSRAKTITITAVEVTRDYSHAKVFYSVLGDSEDIFLAQNGLDNAKGFLRSQLSCRMKLRITPELNFIYDESIERGIRVSKLIDDAVAQDKALQQHNPEQ